MKTTTYYDIYVYVSHSCIHVFMRISELVFINIIGVANIIFAN